jgi:hypothetical protein
MWPLLEQGWGPLYTTLPRMEPAVAKSPDPVSFGTDSHAGTTHAETTATPRSAKGGSEAGIFIGAVRQNRYVKNAIV